MIQAFDLVSVSRSLTCGVCQYVKISDELCLLERKKNTVLADILDKKSNVQVSL